eukprot:10491259-Lingulodinium_polyedra.AAC.1
MQPVIRVVRTDFISVETIRGSDQFSLTTRRIYMDMLQCVWGRIKFCAVAIQDAAVPNLQAVQEDILMGNNVCMIGRVVRDRCAKGRVFTKNINVFIRRHRYSDYISDWDGEH